MVISIEFFFAAFGADTVNTPSVRLAVRLEVSTVASRANWRENRQFDVRFSLLTVRLPEIVKTWCSMLTFKSLALMPGTSRDSSTLLSLLFIRTAGFVAGESFARYSLTKLPLMRGKFLINGFTMLMPKCGGKRVRSIFILMDIRVCLVSKL